MLDFKKNNFFVSCQAIKGEPLYGGDTVLKLAKAAVIGGAQGIRTSQINNIKKIVKANLQVPIIGLIKKKYNNSNVYITPTVQDLQKLIDTEVDVIAIDATLRKRPKQDLKTLVNYFNQNKKQHQLLMADCSNQEDVINALNLKVDLIGTTLRGYTEETKNMSNTENNYEFIRWCVEQIKKTNKKLIAEGGINTPQEAKDVLKIGADAVVVGSAITRPKFITENFIKKIKEKDNE